MQRKNERDRKGSHHRNKVVRHKGECFRSNFELMERRLLLMSYREYSQNRSSRGHFIFAFQPSIFVSYPVLPRNSSSQSHFSVRRIYACVCTGFFFLLLLLFLPTFLRLSYLDIYLFIHLFIHLFICLSIYLLIPHVNETSFSYQRLRTAHADRKWPIWLMEEARKLGGGGWVGF